MTEPKIEVELKDQSQPEDQSETVEQTYNYTINGKSKTVKRKYEVKDKTSFRTKSVREQVKKYVEENKQSLSEINKRHRASTLISNLQKDLNIHISYNSAIKLLSEAGLKE